MYILKMAGSMQLLFTSVSVLPVIPETHKKTQCVLLPTHPCPFPPFPLLADYTYLLPYTKTQFTLTFPKILMCFLAYLLANIFKTLLSTNLPVERVFHLVCALFPNCFSLF